MEDDDSWDGSVSKDQLLSAGLKRMTWVGRTLHAFPVTTILPAGTKTPPEYAVSAKGKYSPTSVVAIALVATEMLAI
jgi:hypothetical protein